MEGRHVAYELLAAHREAAARLSTKTVERLGQGIDNSGSVDAFGVLVAGRAWNAGLVSDAAIARWARSKDRRWRRLALVCTVALNARSHGGVGDVERTFAVCARLAADRDDMVAKALSWALRALSMLDPAAVRAFLRKHEDVLAKRVVREVGNKLETGRKSGARARGRAAGRTVPLARRTS